MIRFLESFYSNYENNTKEHMENLQKHLAVQSQVSDIYLFIYCPFLLDYESFEKRTVQPF